MAYDNDGEYPQTENIRRRNEIFRQISLVRSQIQCLNDLKVKTELLYAKLLDEETRLGQISTALENTEYNLNAGATYWVDRIDYFAHIDDIPGMEELIDIDSIKLVSNTNRKQVYDSIFTDEDGLANKLREFGSQLDTLKAGCAAQIRNLDWPFNVLNSYEIQLKNTLDGIPER